MALTTERRYIPTHNNPNGVPITARYVPNTNKTFYVNEWLVGNPAEPQPRKWAITHTHTNMKLNNKPVATRDEAVRRAQKVYRLYGSSFEQCRSKDDTDLYFSQDNITRIRRIVDAS